MRLGKEEMEIYLASEVDAIRFVVFQKMNESNMDYMDVAFEANISEKTVYAFLYGKNQNPTLLTIICIKSALGISI